MIKKARYLLAAVVVAVLAFALAGCGGNDDPAPSPSPATTPEPTPVFTPAPTPAPPAIDVETYLDPALIGTWGMVGWLEWLMIYNEDGTGLRGMVGGFEEFDWETADGQLWQIFAANTEHWEFTIEDDAITFVNLANGETFAFVRIPDNGDDTTAAADPIVEGDEHDEELFGTWGMYGWLEWLMIYNEDGTGLRGMEGAFEEFTWWTENGELWQNFGGNVEHWSYGVEDGVITFVNMQDAEEMFWFIWIE